MRRMMALCFFPPKFPNLATVPKISIYTVKKTIEVIMKLLLNSQRM